MPGKMDSGRRIGMLPILPGADFWIALLILTMPVRELSLWEFGGGNIRIGDLTLLLVFYLWLLSGLAHGRFVFIRNGLDLSVAVLIMAYALSLTWASNIDAGWVRVLKLIRNGMLYFLLARYLDLDFGKRYRWVAIWLVVSGLVVSVAFLYSISEYGGLRGLRVMLSATSLASNNALLSVVRTDQGAGLFLKGVASWLPLCMFAGFSIVGGMKTTPMRIINWAMIGVMAVLTGLTMTRAAWVSLAVGALITITMSVSGRGVKEARRLLIPVLILSVIGWYFSVGAFISSRLNVEVVKSDPAVTERLDFFDRALQRFGEEPVGGAGVASIDSEELFVVHNVYLQILGELGVVGGVLFGGMVWFWVLFALRARRAAANAGNEGRRQVSIAMLGVTGFFLTYFLVGHDLGSGEPWIVMSIVSALYSSRGSQVSMRDTSQSGGRSLSPVAG